MRTRRPDAVRVRRGEHDRRRAALADADQRGLLEPGRVHDGFELLGSFLDRPDLGDRVGHPDTGLVVDQHAGERRQVLEERGELGRCPHDLDVRDERPGDDDVDVPGAEHLVGEAQVPAARVPCLGHSSRLRPELPARAAFRN